MYLCIYKYSYVPPNTGFYLIVTTMSHNNMTERFTCIRERIGRDKEETVTGKYSAFNLKSQF